jgi:transglutaminase-like putative cysteine protease
MNKVNRTISNILSMLIFLILSACQIEAIELGRQELPSTAQSEEDTADRSGTGVEPDHTDQSFYSNFTIPESIEYEIEQRLKLVNHGPGSPSKLNLWVALIQDVYPYQEVVEREINPGTFQLIVDEYGNEIAEFDFSEMPPDTEIQVKINYRVKVHSLEFDFSDCLGDLPDFFTNPELHIESRNPQIVQLSEQLSKGKVNICAQVRAFYDYIGDNLVYSYNGGNWGAQGALGKMGADCTEYSSLMIALSRAASIPARYIVGLSYTPEGEEGLARKEHAWVEVFLPEIGWTPMDPTLGRSSITREEYYAKLPANHIIVTRGRNSSTMRGASYWTYLYWPGDSTEIKIEEGQWEIIPVEE